MLGVTLTLAGLFSVVVAQVPGFEGCPDVETISTFDVENYMGKWYEQYRYFMIFEAGGKCVTANYSLNNDETVKVVNAQVNSLLGFPSQIEGSARIVDPKDPGKLAVKFPVSPFEGSYWILDTDYDSYAAVWSCQSLLVANTQFAWILTREQNPPQDVIEKAKDAFKKNSISVDLFLKTNQENC
ncbi:apolipoprotein D [Fopius arisanus]|uniref:Apolipoprotein D n=1 Tax=Fopius arisanus TaxID=64838 RepID=A0A9R1U5H3_9HYME|nr:PREDICTED: apolipoprotein D-like [Fopius arisanus]